MFRFADSASMNAPGRDPEAVLINVKVIDDSIPRGHELDQVPLSGIERIARNWNEVSPLAAINFPIDMGKRLDCGRIRTASAERKYPRVSERSTAWFLPLNSRVDRTL